MAFTGTPIVQRVTNNCFRVTGVSLAGSASGEIGFSDKTVPAEIELVAPDWQPYEIDGVVSLQDAVQVTVIPAAVAASVPVPVIKSGTTHLDFALTFNNPSTAILGAGENFAVLASSTITNTGNTVVTGDIGVSPGAAIVGFPPGTVSGTQHAADAAAANAQLAATAAYIQLAAMVTSPGGNLTGINLGGLNLAPGVYNFDTSAQLTGVLTLTGAGLYVFNIGSTLTTAPGASVVLAGGATAGNVFWRIGSSATIDTTTLMKGTMIALASITMNTGAQLVGRAWARTGAVTLDTNNPVTVTGAASSGLASGALEIYVEWAGH